MRQLSVAAALSVLLVAPVAGQGLFRDTLPLDVTFVTSLRALLRERDSTKVTERPAVMTYQSGNGAPRSVPVTLRPRGHFRRQARNCEFPPLKLELERSAARGTLFQGNTDLKITTNCRPGNADYEQYVLSEYAMYRTYASVSPLHYRTRLARITYRDSTRATADVVSWAFFIEDDGEVAKHFSKVIEPKRGAAFSDLESTQLAVTSLFELMIANTDWSISGLHNVSLLRDSLGAISPVAYDFDWSGAVNPRYAFPDARLGIRAVTQRLYRGPCRTLAEWQPVVARFVTARPRIEAVVAGIAPLEARRKRTVLDFFAEFYRMISNDKSVKQSVIDGCLAVSN
jgi:hypothetical protein